MNLWGCKLSIKIVKDKLKWSSNVFFFSYPSYKITRNFSVCNISQINTDLFSCARLVFIVISDTVKCSIFIPSACLWYGLSFVSIGKENDKFGSKFSNCHDNSHINFSTNNRRRCDENNLQ